MNEPYDEKPESNSTLELPEVPNLDLEVAQQLSEIVETQRSARGGNHRLRSPRSPINDHIDPDSIVLNEIPGHGYTVNTNYSAHRAQDNENVSHMNVVSPRMLSTPPKLKATVTSPSGKKTARFSPTLEANSVSFRYTADVISNDHGNILLLSDSDEDQPSSRHRSTITIDLNNVPLAPSRYRQFKNAVEPDLTPNRRFSMRTKSPSSPSFFGAGYTLPSSLHGILKSPSKVDRSSNMVPLSPMSRSVSPPSMKRLRSIGSLSLEGLNPFNRRRSHRSSLTLDLEKIRRDNEYSVDVQIIEEEAMPPTPKTPQEIIEELPKASIRLIDRLKYYLDAYGGSLAGQRDLFFGDHAYLNSALNPLANYYDIPSSQVRIHQKLFLFEKQASSLQRLNIVDNNGYEYTLSSFRNQTDPDRVPITRAYFGEPRLQSKRDNPKHILLIEPFEETFDNVATTESSNYPEELAALYQLRALNEQRNRPFYPHFTVMFFQLARSSQLLPCQLQLGFVSSGKHNLSNNLITDDSTWNFSNASQNNLFSISNSLSAKDYNQLIQSNPSIDPMQFYRYTVIANYASNLNHTQTSHICDGVPFHAFDTDPIFNDGGSRHFTIKILAPLMTDATLLFSVAGDTLLFTQKWNSITYPKKILISGANGLFEIITLTGSTILNSVDKVLWGSFSVIRSRNPINFRDDVPSTNAKLFNDMLNTSTVHESSTPLNWSCPSNKWNDGTICDCDCGDVDPDCLRMLPRFFELIPSYGRYVSSFLADQGLLCSRKGTNFEMPTVSAGPLCDVIKPMAEETKYISGLGCCPICPKSPLFNFAPAYSVRHHQNMCNPPIVSKLDLLFSPYSSENCGLISVYLDVRSPGFPQASDYEILIDLGPKSLKANVVRAFVPTLSEVGSISNGEYDDPMFKRQLLCIAPLFNEQTIGTGIILNSINNSNVVIVAPTTIHKIGAFWANWNTIFGSFSSDVRVVKLQKESFTTGAHVESVVQLENGLQSLVLRHPIDTISLGYRNTLLKVSQDRLNFECIVDPTLVNLQSKLSTGIVRSVSVEKKVEQIFIVDITLNTDRAIFTVRSPLKYEYEEGIDIFETNIDGSNSLVSIVQDDILIRIVQDEAYDPNSSPPDLDIKYALFVVPEKKRFDSDYSLLPLSQPQLPVEQKFKNHPWYSQLSIADDRRHFVEGYQMYDFDRSSCRPLDDSIMNNRTFNCIDEMPPHKVIEYSHITHINNKWHYSPTLKDYLKKNGIDSEPEYTVRFRHEYEFQHDTRADNVDKLFRFEPGETSGSVYSYGRKHYADVGIGTTPRPANNPLLQTQVSIELSKFAVNDVKNLKRLFNLYDGTWRTAKTMGVENFLKQRWSNLNITFDLDKIHSIFKDHVVLKPGVKYHFIAHLDLFCNLTRGTVGFMDASNFQFILKFATVQTEFSKPSQRHMAIVEYSLFISSQKRLIQTVTYNFFNFLSAMGGAVNLAAFGMTLLTIYQCFCPARSILEQIQQTDEQLLQRIRMRQEKESKSFPDDCPTTEPKEVFE